MAAKQHRTIIIIESDPGTGIITDVYGPDNFLIEHTQSALLGAFQFLQREDKAAAMRIVEANKILHQHSSVESEGANV